MRLDDASRSDLRHAFLPTESVDPSIGTNQKSKTSSTCLSKATSKICFGRIGRASLSCFVLACCLGQNCVEIDQMVIPEENIDEVLSNELDVPWSEILPSFDTGENNIVYEGDLVVLEATSDRDPNTNQAEQLSYLWSQTAGPRVELNDPTSLICYFIAPEVDENAILSFTFTGTDGKRAVSASTDVEVYNLNDTPGINVVANAGDDIETNEGESVTLNGNNSSGEDNLLYTWTQISGSSVILSGDQSAIASFIAPELDTQNAETLVFELTVTDGYSATSDLVSVIVNPGTSSLIGDFNSYLAGNHPVDWIDTNAYNSMSENNSLFQVFDLSGEKVFGTTSTETNIHSHYVGPGSATWSAYTYTGQLMITHRDSGIGLTFRSDYPNTDSYYRLRRYNDGTFHINPHGTSVTGDTDTGVVPVPYTWYEFTIEVDDVGNQTAIRAKVWAQGAAEPSDWQVDCYDASVNRLTAGTIGLWSMGLGNKYWDDLAVSRTSCDVDSDGDGILDCTDQCPDDPAKSIPGACGCGVADTDTDADGTADCIDTCPDDPQKTAPGICGCGMADTDSDTDGTPDCNDPCPNDAENQCGDVCPNDPNKTAPGVCGCGVADTDGDQDGTPDCNDNCPNDPDKTEPGMCGCGWNDVDSDSDGTSDCYDVCIDDPNKTLPGICGCGLSDADSDDDGTVDCNDLCPNDADKTKPGACGCGWEDTDSDGDGIADCYDVCMDDPNKMLPGMCGCGLADTDSDGDKTLDCDDACPDDPNKIDAGQCGCGLADTDTDGDGIADCEDTCPNDPDKIEPSQCGCGSVDTDSDTDGTADCNDECPSNPNKTEPGVCGCVSSDNDSDNDGTLDCNDLCPNDSNKIEPGDCGCGVADTDSDGDGTPDCQEQDTSTYSEDFNGYSAGTDPVDWIDTGANNSMNENDSLFQVFDLGGEKVFDTTSTETNIHSHYVGSGSATWSAYTYTGRMMITHPDGGVGVTFRSDYPNTDRYYRLRRYNDGTFHINPHGTSVAGDTDTGIVPATNTWYEFTIEVEDVGNQTVIRAKVWAQGSAEPADWQVDCYDANASRLAAGTVGVWSMGSGAKYWDDLAVSGLSCDTDSDGDGVLDCHDQCPDDPAKSIPGTCGCGVPQTDSDGDSIADCNDVCPGEPDMDSDGDGVADCDDICPGADDAIDSNGDGTPDGCEPATLCAGPTSLDFSCNKVSQTFEVWNCGSGDLDFLIEKDASWLSVSATSGSSSGEHDTITVTVNRAGLPDGDHAAEITVSSNVGTPIIILVTLASGCPQQDTEPMLTASRISGMAPLAVFFDATDPVSGVVQPSQTGEYANDHASLYYEWEFDDPYAGSWSTGRQNLDGSYPSKNSATGYVAAHVFEQPGDYTVRLHVVDPNGQEYHYSQPITVQPFSGTTFYVRQDGNDSNTGRGPTADQAWRTYAKAFGAISGNSIVKPGDRVLFQRGHVFPYSSTSRLTNAHNVIIGAYPEDGDPDTRPLIQYTGSAEHLDVPAFQVYGNCTAITLQDVRINGHSTTSGKYASGFAVNSFLSAGPVNDVLMLRIAVEEFWNNYFDVGVSPMNGVFLVESTIRNSNDYKGHMLLGKAGKLAILGCVVDRGPTGEGQWGNNMYLEGLDKSVISSNYIGRPNPTSATLHIAGNKRPAHHVVMSDNILDGMSSIPGRPSNVNVTFDATDPQNYWVDNLLFERNLVIHGGELVLTREGNDKVTVRNNILMPSDEGTAVVLEREYLWGSLGPIRNMSIYNNTIITNSTKTAIRVVASIENIRISNNIIEHTSTASTARLIQIFGSASASEITSDFNLYSVPNRSASAVAFSVGDSNYTLSQWLSTEETHSVEAAPQFANGDYALLETSPAIDAGMFMGLPTELPYDVPTRTPWPSISGANIYDIGAIEWRP